MPSRKHFNSGEPVSSFTADDYRDIMARIDARRRLAVTPPLRIVDNSPTTIDLALPEGFWATLSGSASPYSFAEKYAASSGTWATRVRTGTTNAYEVNGVAGLNGKVAWLEPGAPGDYRFQMVTGGGTVTPPTGSIPGCVCATPPRVLTITPTSEGCGLIWFTDTITYKPRPAALTGVPGTTANGYYGDTIHIDPTSGDPFIYYLVCFGALFGLNLAYLSIASAGGSPGLSGGVSWSWSVGSGGSTCVPFYLAGGSPPPGNDDTCLPVITG